MPHFTDLPQAHGWGNWHVNRFRVAFRLAPGAPPMTSAHLASHFINNFPGYVNSPAATVQNFRLGGESLYKFHGALPVIGMRMPHFDWVRVIWLRPSQGFTVQTLHRDTPDGDDGQMTGVGAAAGGLAGAVAAYVVNRFHILAGRRSWLLRPASPLAGPHDPQLPATDFILETAAIERISIPFFLPMTPAIENALPAVWQNLLANFVTGFPGLQQVQYPPEAGWKITPRRGVDVHWYALNFPGLADVQKSPYAVDVLNTFYGILDTSSTPTHELSQLLDKLKSVGQVIM